MVGGSSGHSEKRGLAAVAHPLQNQQMGFGSCSRLSFRVTGPLPTPLAMAVLCSLHPQSPSGCSLLFPSSVLFVYFSTLFCSLCWHSDLQWVVGPGRPRPQASHADSPCSARCSRKSWPTYARASLDTWGLPGVCGRVTSEPLLHCLFKLWGLHHCVKISYHLICICLDLRVPHSYTFSKIQTFFLSLRIFSHLHPTWGSDSWPWD